MLPNKPTQVENGKAFEFAIASAFSAQLDAPIKAGRELELSKRCFEKIEPEKQKRFHRSAVAAVAHILQLEDAQFRPRPRVRIRFNNDREGQSGDVRDVLVEHSNNELGVSCKTNHDAFKHSRLSGKIDFVKKWGLSTDGCSDAYWTSIRPVFGELAEIRSASDSTAQWSHLERVPERFYWPVLDAFEIELLRLTGHGAGSAKEVTKHLVAYLVGSQDFYKVIDRSKVSAVEVLAFNFNGTLSVVRTRFPELVIGVDRLNGGRYSKTVRLSRGFTFNFRIHSASSRVEPSLKFDITAVSLPPSEVYTNHLKLD